MEFKELTKKSTTELQKLLEESRQKLQDLRFKVASRQQKNIREIRIVKKSIAQILMLLKGKQLTQSSAPTTVNKPETK